jgi:protease I
MRKLKALILTWNGFQDQELVYPYYRLLGADIETTIVADSRDEKGRIYGILGVSMPCQVLLEEFLSKAEAFQSDYDLLVLPGGVKALEKLRQEKKVIAFVRKWNASNKLIASTCHGAQILISADVVSGRRVAGYYSIQDDIENAGATYSREPVAIDGNLVTSPHYDHMGAWMEAALKALQKATTINEKVSS